MARDNKGAAKKKPRGGFTQVYNAFLDTDRLTQYDKMVFIAIKSFADNKTKKAFPSLATISRISGVSLSQVRRCIDKLQGMDILKVEHRQDVYNNGRISNLYTLYDSPDMWDEEFSSEAEDYKMAAQELPDEVLEEEYQRRFLRRKKELTDGTDQSSSASTSSELNINFQENLTPRTVRNQERYSMEEVQELFGYADLMERQRYDARDLDSVFNILYDTMNTTRKTIRVAGEDRPAMVVIGKLMQLTSDEIQYSIDKYNSVTDRIQNPKAYMLAILYGAKEQYNLDLANEVQHDMHGRGVDMG